MATKDLPVTAQEKRMFGKLTTAVESLACAVRDASSQQAVLNALGAMEERINMKQSEVKAIVAAAAGKTNEALGEIGVKIADLQKQIQDLIDGAGDPDITDEAFLADLNTLKANTDALAEIVPTPTP